MKLFKVVAAVLVAAFTMGLAASSASADRGDVITVSPGGAINASSTGRLTLSSPLVTINCVVSFDGSVNAGPITQTGTIDTVGSVSRAVITSCNTGSAVALFDGGNWTINAVLPLPAGGAALRIGNSGIGVTVAGVTCLYGGTIGSSATDIFLANPSDGTNIVTFTRAPVARVSGNALLCGSSASLTGTMEVSPGQTITLS
jgi:hypothetical protein